MSTQTVTAQAEIDRKKALNRARVARHRAKKKAAKAVEARVQPGHNVRDTVPDIRRAVDWIERTLVVPVGISALQPFVIWPWQRDFLDGAFGLGIDEAGLSVARKNGKSGLIAAVLLAFLAGPLNRPLWRAIVTSLTAQLAAELKAQIRDIANASGMGEVVRDWRSPTPGRVTGRDKSEVTFLAADKGTGHALGADLAIIDEGGLMGDNLRPLWNAVHTCTSGRGGRFMTISIQGDGPMFAELRERRDEPGVYFQLHAAPDGCDLDDRDAWAAANPGLGPIKSVEYMESAARRVANTPADQSYFRAYDLNNPLDPGREMICTVQEWLACVDDSATLSGPVCLGVDLGGSTSMTCAVAIDAAGRMKIWSAFPDKPSIAERQAADAVGNRYQRMLEAGELILYPGRVVPVGEFLRTVLDELTLTGCDVEVLGADRYRKAEVEQLLDDAGAKFRLVLRGTGASAVADGSHDVRAFQRLVVAQGIRVRQSIVMESAIAESAVARDTGGNPKLDKSRARGRIDALQAGVIAAGLHIIQRERKSATHRIVG